MSLVSACAEDISGNVVCPGILCGAFVMETDALWDEELYVGAREISDGILFLFNMINEGVKGVSNPDEGTFEEGIKLGVTCGACITPSRIILAFDIDVHLEMRVAIFISI